MRDSIGNINSLAKDTEEKDLGILFQENLKFQAPIWSPYSKLQINQIEKVQRTAAPWTCCLQEMVKHM